MSTLGKAVEQYLAVRRALGFKLDRPARLLPDFVAYLDREGAFRITTALALKWAKQPTGAHPSWWAHRLLTVRCFARYLQALDAGTEVPPASLLPMRVRRATPYPYSEADIERLMEAAGQLRLAMTAATYRTLIGLLAVTGLRVGEAIRLDRQDVDFRQALLVVRHSKFGKSREVALHDTTVAALRGYARLRDRLVRRLKSPGFFVSRAGTRLHYSNVHLRFQRLARRVGLQARSALCRPRLHDLRHRFAVLTLLEWYRTGQNVEALMPRLSTYLGHSDPASTYWYLSAAPELMALAAERLDRAGRRQP